MTVRENKHVKTETELGSMPDSRAVHLTVRSADLGISPNDFGRSDFLIYAQPPRFAGIPDPIFLFLAGDSPSSMKPDPNSLRTRTGV